MMMKMAAVSTITLLLLCCSVASAGSQGPCDKYATTGDNVTVVLLHTLKNSEKLRWRHDGKQIFHRQNANVFVLGNNDSIHQDGSLKLPNVQKNNNGLYEPEVFDENGQAIKNLKSTRLCILDRVPMPTVKVNCLQSTVSLTCTVKQTKDLKFEWLQNSNVLEEKTATLTLNLEKAAKDSFSCRVSNVISNMTSKPVQPCQKFFLPETIFGINTWIVVGAGGGVVLVLIVIVIVFCVQTRRRKRLQLKDEGELRLAWTNDQQQQQQHQHSHPPNQRHHHHHHQQQQPAGHTGPRQHRPKQHRDQQRPKAPDHGHPLPSPRRPAQVPTPVDDEQPPPLPQPRKKAPKTPRA